MSTSKRKYTWSQRHHRQAADWLVRFEQPNFSLSDWERWLRWYAVPENQAAYDEVESHWLQLDFATLSAAAKMLNTGERKHAYAIEDHATSAMPEVANGSRRGASFWALAAGFAALAVAVLLILASLMAGETMQTAAGQWDKRLLDDGTVAYVGPKSRLEIDFASDERAVTIVRGEALFEIAKDPQRPFVVRSEVGVVTAVGTRFGVVLSGAEMVVTVSEGEVSVSAGRARRGSPKKLTAGMQATIKGDAVDQRTVDADRLLLPIKGWCYFQGETLAEAAFEFNRRNELQIRIEDKMLARYRLHYFAFRCDNPEAFAKAVAALEPFMLIKEGSILTLKAGAAGSGVTDDN